jgi:hypothetical protein
LRLIFVRQTDGGNGLVFNPKSLKRLGDWCEQAGIALIKMACLILLLHTLYLIVRHECGF